MSTRASVLENGWGWTRQHESRRGQFSSTDPRECTFEGIAVNWVELKRGGDRRGTQTLALPSLNLCKVMERRGATAAPCYQPRCAPRGASAGRYGISGRR